jgi:ribosome-binding factor A
VAVVGWSCWSAGAAFAETRRERWAVPGRRREKRAPAAYARTARVNEVLREVVAEALERMADTDDRLRLLTVTAVDITPDLSRATVFLSSLPAPAIEALAEQRRELQRIIGRQVRMKRTPLLEFESDPAVAHGLRVEEILRTLRESPSDDDSDGGGDAGTR